MARAREPHSDKPEAHRLLYDEGVGEEPHAAPGAPGPHVERDSRGAECYQVTSQRGRLSESTHPAVMREDNFQVPFMTDDMHDGREYVI